MGGRGAHRQRAKGGGMNREMNGGERILHERSCPTKNVSCGGSVSRA